MISNYTAPSTYSSSQDALWHAAVSDASGLTNFKYIFDVYDASGNQLIRAKIYPDPVSGYGYFDAGGVIRNEITYGWLSNINPITNPVKLYSLNTDNEIGQTYSVKVGEEYNVGASGITNVGLASGTTTAYNYFPMPFTRRRKSINDYANKWLTNRPLYATTDKDSLPIMIGWNGTGNKTIKLNIYNAGGGTLFGGQVTLALGSKNYHQLDISPTAVNNLFSIQTGIDTERFDFNVAAYYTVAIDDIKIKITINCKRDYEPVNLYFINALGVFDTARFDCMNKLSLTATRKTYTKKDVQFSIEKAKYYNTITSTNQGVYNETKTNYAQQIDWTYKLMMNFPTDAEWEWLSELIYSPQIYMLKDNFYYPVTIKTSNHEYYKQVYSKLKTFEVEIEVNQKRNAFRR